MIWSEPPNSPQFEVRPLGVDRLSDWIPPSRLGFQKMSAMTKHWSHSVASSPKRDFAVRATAIRPSYFCDLSAPAPDAASLDERPPSGAVKALPSDRIGRRAATDLAGE